MPCSDLSSLNPDVLKDLKFQLRYNLHEIIKCYNSYVTCIRSSIIKQGKTAKELCSFLMGLSAFSHGDKMDTLLCDCKLDEVVDIHDIFILLLKDYSSFLNYGIFQTLQEQYVTNEGQEELKYPERLRAYIEKHKIEEFVEIKLIFGEMTAISRKMTLRFDIEVTCKLAKVKSLENEIANIMRINPTGLRLRDIKEGCVIVTFLILNTIARVIFAGDKHKIFTKKQMENFRTLPIRWLKCDEYSWNFDKEVRINIPGEYH